MNTKQLRVGSFCLLSWRVVDDKADVVNDKAVVLVLSRTGIEKDISLHPFTNMENVY